MKLAIVSNKIDFAVKELSRDYFPGERMQAAVGDDPEPQTQARAGQCAGSDAADGRHAGGNRLRRRFGCGRGNGTQRGRDLLRGELGLPLSAVPEGSGRDAHRRNTERAAGDAGGAVKNNYHAVLVLGLELNPDDSATPELEARLQTAAEVWRRMGADCGKIVLCGGVHARASGARRRT